MYNDDLDLVPDEHKAAVFAAIEAAGPAGIGWAALNEAVELDGDAIDAALRALKREGTIRHSAELEAYVPASVASEETADGSGTPPAPRQREALRVLARREDLLGAIARAAYEYEHGHRPGGTGG